MPNRRWRTTISSARRMSPSFIPTSRSASMAPSIAAPMSAISCWPPRRLASGRIPQALALARHSGLIRRHFKLGDDRPRGLRNFVWICRQRGQGQQLPDLARQRADTVTFSSIEPGQNVPTSRTARGLTRASIGFKAGCHLFDGLPGQRRRKRRRPSDG